MSTIPLRLLTALSRRLSSPPTPRQVAWHLRFLAQCLIGAVAHRLSLAARSLMRATRNRLSGMRRIWVSPDSLAVVVLITRSPWIAFRIRCLRLHPHFFESGHSRAT